MYKVKQWPEIATQNNFSHVLSPKSAAVNYKIKTKIFLLSTEISAIARNKTII